MTERLFILTAQTLHQRLAAVGTIAADLVKRGDWDLVLRERKAKRSRDQNRRYWALIRECAETVWIDGRQFKQDTWHEFFRREFIGKTEVEMPSGELVSQGISTTTLSVAEFTDYMQRIEQWCADQGYPLGMAA